MITSAPGMGDPRLRGSWRRLLPAAGLRTICIAPAPGDSRRLHAGPTAPPRHRRGHGRNAKLIFTAILRLDAGRLASTAARSCGDVGGGNGPVATSSGIPAPLSLSRSGRCSGGAPAARRLEGGTHPSDGRSPDGASREGHLTPRKNRSQKAGLTSTSNWRTPRGNGVLRVSLLLGWRRFGSGDGVGEPSGSPAEATTTSPNVGASIASDAPTHRPTPSLAASPAGPGAKPASRRVPTTTADSSASQPR